METFYEDAVASAAMLITRLRTRSKTLASAESYTGGLLTALLTEIPGSSHVVQGGVCAYATQSKIAVLGIDARRIADYGVVSCETAAAMAEAACGLFNADYGIATTGIAGPEGGSLAHAVGSICWAVAERTSAGRVKSQSFADTLTGSRSQIRFATAQQIFHYLYQLLEEKK
jgi:PncC family amidohydrolase